MTSEHGLWDLLMLILADVKIVSGYMYDEAWDNHNGFNKKKAKIL